MVRCPSPLERRMRSARSYQHSTAAVLCCNTAAAKLLCTEAQERGEALQALPNGFARSATTCIVCAR